MYMLILYTLLSGSGKLENLQVDHTDYLTKLACKKTASNIMASNNRIFAECIKKEMLI